METSTALDYEYLIRTAHQCNKYAVLGADAELFARLESVEKLLQSKIEQSKKSRKWNKRIEELIFEYGHRSGEVATHIIIAIEQVLMEYDELLTVQYKEKLIDCKINLSNAGIEQIRIAMLQLQDIMVLIRLGSYK